MSDPYFFGYGSLVNVKSHNYPDPRPARLQGWRRAWVATERYETVLLSGVPAAGHTIDGLIAAVPGADWLALDTREAGYGRHDATADTIHEHVADTQIAVYAVAQKDIRPRRQQVILLSYLDVVVQGFHQVYGPDGVGRFFDTTDGWDTPVLDDRDDPIYPRHQTLTTEQTDLVDQHLQRLFAQVHKGHQATLPPKL